MRCNKSKESIVEETGQTYRYSRQRQLYHHPDQSHRTNPYRDKLNVRQLVFLACDNVNQALPTTVNE